MQWDADATGATASAAAARSGAYGGLINPSASIVNRSYQLSPAPTHTAMGRIYFRFPTALPSGDIDMMRWNGSTLASAGYRLWFINSDDTIRMTHYSSTNVLQQSQTGPVIVADTWYRLDWMFHGSSASQEEMRWIIAVAGEEGTEYTPVSDSTFLGSFVFWRLGSGNSQTCTLHLDDAILIWGTDSGEGGDVGDSWPLGDGYVKRLAPEGVGTHSGSGSFAASSGTLADSWQLLDNLPMNTATGYIEQNIVGTGDYLEYTMSGLDADETLINAASIYASVRSSGLASNNFKVHVIDGANDLTVFNAAWLDISSPWGINDNGVPVSGTNEWGEGAWDQARINALLVRVGYSSDVDSIPRLPAFQIEVDISEAIEEDGYWEILLE